MDTTVITLKQKKIIFRSILDYHIIHDIMTIQLTQQLETLLSLAFGFSTTVLEHRRSSIIDHPQPTYIHRLICQSPLSGIIHVVATCSSFLLPPSVFQVLHMVPHLFSTLVRLLFSFLDLPSTDFCSSAVWVDRSTRPSVYPSQGIRKLPSDDYFAPTNHAFEALPKNLSSYILVSHTFIFLHKIEFSIVEFRLPS